MITTIILTLLGFANNVFSDSEDNWKFNYINVENGLSSNIVYCVYQDREGMMWFGTNDGLSRYDTYEVKTWRNDPKDPNSLGSNVVYCIQEDLDGRLWLGTEGGVFVYDKLDASFSFPLPITADSQIRSITLDKMGRVWMASLGNGVFCYDPVPDSIEHYQTISEDCPTSYVSKILSDAVGNVWCVGDNNQLHKWDDNAKCFTGRTIVDSERMVEMAKSFTMCTDWSGNLWIAGWDSGIFHYDKTKDRFTSYLFRNGKSLIPGRIHSINEISPGVVLIGSDYGLGKFELKSGKFNSVQYGSRQDRGLSDNFVYDILQDREAGLWVATWFGGVNYANPNSKVFRLRRCSEDNSQGRVISRFCESADGDIWIGTDDGGLYKYELGADRCRKIDLDPKTAFLNIHALLEYGDDLWVGTYMNGLYRMNIRTGKTVHYEKFEGDERSVYSLFIDKCGKLWIGTKSSIMSWSERSGFSNELILGPNSDVIEIDSDTYGNVYFASKSKGLYEYNARTYKIAPIGSDLPREITAMSINHDQIWIGTLGRGLLKYDPEVGGSSVIISNAQMGNLSVFQIVNDDNHIWITSNEGLIKLNVSTYHTSVYGKEDGLKTNVLNYNSGIRASNGTIYIGSNEGFNFFDPNLLQLNQTSPKLVISATSPKASYDAGVPMVKLKKRYNQLRVDFAVLSYRSPARNRYRYMVEGLDEEYHEMSWKDNSIYLTDLPLGDYTLKIEGCNNDGVWCNEPAFLRINVSSYWYNSVYAIVFYSVVAALVLALICILLLNFNRQKRKRRSEKIKYVREKTKIETELQFMTNMVHEIRTPVMLINSPVNEILVSDTLEDRVLENVRLIKKSSDRLFKLTSEILDFRKYSSDMRTEANPIVSLTKQIVEEFAVTTASYNINLSFVDETDGEIIVDINAEAWNKILGNLLSNAIKFTKDTIMLKIKKENETLLVSVWDNGYGVGQDDVKKIFDAFWHDDNHIVRSVPGFGLGLSVTGILIHKMGMSIKVRSEKEKYTEFEISVPLKEVETTEPVPEEADGQENNKAVPVVKAILPATIMIVEEDPDLRTYVENSLSDYYDTLSVGNGEEAMDMLNSGKKIDLIIGDVSMRRISGIELCSKIKNNIDYCHIPIILLSSDMSSEVQETAMESGCDVLLSKAMETPHLMKQINNLLEKRRILWDSFSKRPFQALSSGAGKNVDEVFLNRFSEAILQNVSKVDLTVDDLASALNMSRSVLYSKVKNMTGITPNNFIKIIRLRKAAELMSGGEYKINEICWMVGFNTPSYFSKCFFEQYGVLPKDFDKRRSTAVDGEGD